MERNQRISTLNTTAGKDILERRSADIGEDPLNIFLESDTDSELSQDPVIDDLSSSYKDFNKKTFKTRADYLYHKGMLQDKRRTVIHEKAKKLKEKIQLEACSFKPKINCSFPVNNADIVTKTKDWQHHKRTQCEKNEKLKTENELSKCTFYPNGKRPRRKISKLEAADFYKRNVEWKDNKEAMIDSKGQQTDSKAVTKTSAQNDQKKATRKVHSFVEHHTKAEVSKTNTETSSGPEICRNEQRMDQPADIKQRKKFFKRKLSPQQQPNTENSAALGLQELLGIREFSPVRGDIEASHAIFKSLEKKIAQNKTIEDQKQKQKSEDKEAKPVLKTLPYENKDSKGEILDKGKFQPNDEVRSMSKVDAQQSKELAITSSEFGATYLRANFDKITVKNNRYYIDPQLNNSKQSHSFAWNSSIEYDDSNHDSSLMDKLPLRSSLKSNKSSRRSSIKRVSFVGESPLAMSFDLQPFSANEGFPSASSTTRITEDVNKICRGSGPKILGELDKKYQELLAKCQKVSVKPMLMRHRINPLMTQQPL